MEKDEKLIKVVTGRTAKIFEDNLNEAIKNGYNRFMSNPVDSRSDGLVQTMSKVVLVEPEKAPMKKVKVPKTEKVED